MQSGGRLARLRLPLCALSYLLTRSTLSNSPLLVFLPHYGKPDKLGGPILVLLLTDIWLLVVPSHHGWSDSQFRRLW